MKDESAMKVLEATAIRRRLRTLYAEHKKGSKLTQKRKNKIEKEIFELQQKMKSLNKTYQPKLKLLNPKTLHKQRSPGNCINPKCRKKIPIGQAVVKYGHKGLCCDYKCLIGAMNGS
ncbi:hypothetical protein NST58_06435 [Paenibacillus sp. FSL R10-2796]|uniref:hypothetical protein n=1 Tax=Paenibacillus sp. FSL R10-2796 TaxID=2954663 RepID=UPI0030DD4581